VVSSNVGANAQSPKYGESTVSEMLAYLFGRILSVARARGAVNLDFHAGD